MILIVLLLSLILRLINLNQSLWLDEAINIIAAKNYNLFDLITKYTAADFHPPGYFILIWFWGRLGNFSEVWMRIPSVLFGVLTIYVVYLIGKKLTSKRFGMVTALLLAVNPLHIYYSQEARMYSLATLAVSVNMYFFIKLSKGGENKLPYIILSNLFVLTSDYLAYLIFPAQIFLLFLRKKAYLLKYWLSGIVISLFGFLFWIPVFLSQIKIGSSAIEAMPIWKNVVGAFGLKTLGLTYIKFIIGRISYPDKYIYALSILPTVLLISFLIWNAYKKQKEKTISLGFLLVIPIFLAQLISLVVPVYSYFRLLFILPLFIMIIVLGLESVGKLKKVFITLLILIELFYSSIYFINPLFQREDWRGVVNFFKLNKNPMVLLESTGMFPPYEYYSTNHLMTAKLIPGIGALKNMPARTDNDLKNLDQLLAGVKDIYLMDYLVDINDPERLVKNELIKLGYKNVDTKDFSGVGFVYHYVK